MTSTTFIRREIEAIEAAGQPIKRFAVRHWDIPLVDPADKAEQERTEYLLSGNLAPLLATALVEALRQPVRLARALSLCSHYYRAAGGGLVRHVGYLLQALRFRRRADQLGIDHVHAHFSTNATAVASLAYALGGPTFSFTVHGPDELVDPANNALGRKMSNAAFVVAITEFCCERLRYEAPAYHDKVCIIRCGIDLREFTVADQPRITRDIVCVGRLCANKAQTLIPRAFAAFAGEHPQVTIDLVGDGEDRALIEEEIERYGLADRIKISGWATAGEVRAKIKASSILLLPSLAEGLPIVLMEALAMGRPVLTTKIAGIPELVDDGCGWIIEAGSATELAAALRHALSASAELLTKKGLEGRRRVEAMHDIQDSARKLIAAFRSTARDGDRSIR